MFHLKTGTQTAKHMNPIGYYLSTNNELRKYIMDILDETNSIIKDAELRNVINKIKLDGSDIEKIQAVSLLRAVRIFFS